MTTYFSLSPEERQRFDLDKYVDEMFKEPNEMGAIKNGRGRLSDAEAKARAERGVLPQNPRPKLEDNLESTPEHPHNTSNVTLFVLIALAVALIIWKKWN